MPPPSLWPVGFAVGIAVLLIGLIVGWHIVVLGAVLAAAFGFLWIRDLTTDVRGPVPEIEPERRELPVEERRGGPAPPVPADVGGPALPRVEQEEIDRFPRSKFLEGATLGVGGLIGGVVTLPAVGMMVLPAFTGQEKEFVDVGPVDDFPEGEWRITTFLQNPEEGEVSRRTAYVRNNGRLGDVPSFTVVSNRCAHLGCPVQPNGPVDDQAASEVRTDAGVVVRIPTQPAGFGCPCHGGQYDNEGNRTAGPPVRALDRYEFAVRDGRLFLGNTYSVGTVRGEGKEARIAKYELVNPGVHVDGPEAWLYPLEAPK